MRTFRNETNDKRLVITRTARFSVESPTNIILLPGEERDVDESVYELGISYDPLSEGDEAALDARAADAAEKRLEDHVQMEREARANGEMKQISDGQDAAGVPLTGSGSVLGTGAGSDGNFQNAVGTDVNPASIPAQPPVDNAFVADGAEQFAQPQANPSPAGDSDVGQAVGAESAASGSDTADKAEATPA